MITKKKVNFLIELLKLVGTNFKWYGRDEKGLDCLGLFITARNRAGYSYFDYKTYSTLPRNKNFPHLLESISKSSFNNLKKLTSGDLMLIKYGKSLYPHHLMIYIGDNKVIHTDLNDGVVIEDINEKIIKDVYCIYRF